MKVCHGCGDDVKRSSLPPEKQPLCESCFQEALDNLDISKRRYEELILGPDGAQLDL